MMYQGTNLCANASTNIDTNYIFPISNDFCVKFDYFAQKISNLKHIQHENIAYIFYSSMNYSFAKFYDILSSNVDTSYIFHFLAIFRAQEPKAPVTYCDHTSGVRPSSVRRPSSVKLFTFSTSSPEPLDGFWWNLAWMKYSRSLTSVVVFRPDPSRGGSRAGQK